MEKISKELIGASSIPIILTILSQGESYGYEIIQKIKEASDGKLDWAEGTLYPILHKLEQKGLIHSYWKESDTGRSRKYYALQSSGIEKLAYEKENWLTVHVLLSKLWKIQPSLT